MNTVEPRSTSQIMADLLQAAIDSEWSGRYHSGCHCHPEYHACCPACKTLEGEPHTQGCTRKALIEETRAYLRVENQLAEERGEDTIWFP